MTRPELFPAHTSRSMDRRKPMMRIFSHHSLEGVFVRPSTDWSNLRPQHAIDSEDAVLSDSFCAA
jgi:hypothetical protein